MPHVNFDIALYRSPYFENLISEFYRISRYKRNIYKKISTEEEYEKKLSAEEKTILKDLSEKENKILLEILSHKNWVNRNGELEGYPIKLLGKKLEPVL